MRDMEDEHVRLYGESGLSTWSKIGFTSMMRNAAIAPTRAINTTDASEYSAYGRT